MLSQQNLMEIFIFGLNEPEKICSSRDDPDDVCEWQGVECNADGEVAMFEWTDKNEDGAGTLGFEFLPWSMKYVRVYTNALSGTIQLALIRRKATSSWWFGPVPRRGGSQEPSKLSSCFCLGADPIDSCREVVGQD